MQKGPMPLTEGMTIIQAAQAAEQVLAAAVVAVLVEQEATLLSTPGTFWRMEVMQEMAPVAGVLVALEKAAAVQAPELVAAAAEAAPDLTVAEATFMDGLAVVAELLISRAEK